MEKYTKKQILELAREEDVEFVRLQFCDLSGKLKNMAILASHLEEALEHGWVFEGQQWEAEGNYFLKKIRLIPDPDTFEILPFRPQTGKVARLICDMEEMDGTPFCQDSRKILRDVVARAESMGYRLLVAPEYEFFLFDLDDQGQATTQTYDQGNCYDIGPRDRGENVRRDIIENLGDMGFDVLCSYHEFSPGQHEIDFKHADALQTADRMLTFKMTLKAVAKTHGYHATFMPKPLEHAAGSGLHLRLALVDMEGKNLFFDAAGEHKISRLGGSFMAGLEEHIGGITAFGNPLVNSYKRLQADMEAPILVGWSLDCTDTFLQYDSEGEGDMWLELRSPDGTSNPYLTLALCLAAGLDGIEKEMELPKENEILRHSMSVEEATGLGIRRVPRNLEIAIRALRSDEVLGKVLTDQILFPYVTVKQKECDAYNKIVTDWEIRKYLEIY